jgi:hypothetical protein
MVALDMRRVGAWSFVPALTCVRCLQARNRKCMCSNSRPHMREAVSPTPSSPGLTQSLGLATHVLDAQSLPPEPPPLEQRGARVCGGAPLRRREAQARGRREALRKLTRCRCLSVESEANIASSAARPRAEHRRAVEAKRRPPKRSTDVHPGAPLLHRSTQPHHRTSSPLHPHARAPPPGSRIRPEPAPATRPGASHPSSPRRYRSC